MTVKINGWLRDGAFQTGKGQSITLWVAHAIEATGVQATRAELLADSHVTSATLAANNSFTVDGTEYTTDAAYDEALWRQQNLDRILGVFAPRANIAHLDVYAGVATAATPTADFANVFLAGIAAHTFGTDLIAANAMIWRLDVTFEQKGVFTTGTKGDVTLAGGDNQGDTVATVEALFTGVVMNATVATDGLDEDIFGGAVVGGDDVTIAQTVTRQSVLAEVSVAPDMQS